MSAPCSRADAPASSWVWVGTIAKLLPWVLGSMLAVLVQNGGSTARAQDVPETPQRFSEAAPKDPPKEALAHYNRGREHYQAGRYREALTELEIAVNLDPTSPNLVYNVARVYELLGEIDHAIAFYRRYRDMLPENEQAERERTESTLQRLEGARRHNVAPPPKAPEPERRRGVADAAFWSVASVAALSLGAAGATGVLALTTQHDSEQFELGEDGTEKGRQKLIDRANRLALASDTLLLAGASLGVTAILLYALRERPVSPKVQAASGFGVHVWSDGALVAFRGAL